MRVLIVHNRYRPVAPSGEDAVVDQESAALIERGHEVQLFQRFSQDIADWSIARRATLPVRVLWSRDSRRSISERLQEFRPDVVHVHNTFPLITPSMLYACRDAGVPVVATIHNYRLGCASGELFRDSAVCHDCLSRLPVLAVTHGCYRGSRAASVPVVIGSAVHAKAWRTLVSAYAFTSAAQRDILAPVGIPADRSFVRHNFVPEPSAIATAKQHQVAYVGRLDEAKGVPFLMRAWDAFRATRPDSPLRLVIAGGGNLADAVTAWAAQHPSVTMAGLVSRSEVSAILGGSRAAIVPSQWEETFGMVAVEAMAAGTGVIASGHGAFPEIITAGSDGATFVPTDLSGLVELICSVDDDPDRWHRYGIQGQETYRANFTREASLDRLLRIYRFAIEHPIRHGATSQPPIAPSSSRASAP